MIAPHRVTVRTGSRLHFGLLSMNPALPRQFGGCGVMLRSPGFEVTLERARETSIDAPASLVKRIRDLIDGFCRDIPAEVRPPAVAVNVTRSIPLHTGFGSGTQLGLAIAAGLARFTEISDELTPESLAVRAARGKRSAIGIHGFFRGGTIIDAGKLRGEDVAPVVARMQFPRDWRFFLARPQKSRGLSAKRELAAFDDIPILPAESTGELCRILLQEWIPAVRETDYPRASRSLGRFGDRVGRHFSSVQNSVFANELMGQLAEELRAEGFAGVGQSSWGPTLFCLCPDAAAAENLVETYSNRVEFAECQFRVASALNRPARITIE